MSSLEKYQLEVFAQLLIGLFIFIWDSLVAQLVKYLPAKPGFNPWVGKIP